MIHDGSIYRKELRGRIVGAAMLLFHRQGIKAVRMDDIAKELSISKRTLYEVYNKKEELLYEVVKEYHERRFSLLSEKTKNMANVIDIVAEVYKILILEVRDINPLFFEELYLYPQVMKYKEQLHEELRRQRIAFIERGIEEGFFRCDINYELVQSLFDATNSYIKSGCLYKHYTMEELFRSIVFTLMRGICTESGVKRIDQFLNESTLRSV